MEIDVTNFEVTDFRSIISLNVEPTRMQYGVPKRFEFLEHIKDDCAVLLICRSEASNPVKAAVRSLPTRPHLGGYRIPPNFKFTYKFVP